MPINSKCQCKLMRIKVKGNQNNNNWMNKPPCQKKIKNHNQTLMLKVNMPNRNLRLNKMMMLRKDQLSLSLQIWEIMFDKNIVEKNAANWNSELNDSNFASK